jgi:hypothetical protein
VQNRFDNPEGLAFLHLLNNNRHGDPPAIIPSISGIIISRQLGHGKTA